MTLEWRVFRDHFFLVSICTIAAAAAASASTLNLLGIAPQDVSHYKSGLLLWCKDGSKRFSLDRLNDDFCDCPDGTDEPGTSACPSGRFYCTNQQQEPLWVFSSRVNDGICDCCDGSDEYDGRVHCRPVCTIEHDDSLLQAQFTKEKREVTMRDRTKSLLLEKTESEQTDASSKSYFLQVLELLELVLVILALWQFYCWTFRGGFGSRKRLPR